MVRRPWISAALLITLSACSAVNGALTPAPAPDSGFLQGQSAQLTPQPERYPFDRVWEDPEFRASGGEPLEILIAPVNTDYVQNPSWWRKDRAAAQEAVRGDAQRLAAYLHRAFSGSLQGSSGTRVKVVERAGPQTVMLDIAITEVRPTEVARAVVANAASAFLPGMGLLAAGSQGSIAIEGRLQRVRDGKTLFMFADREKGKLSLISVNDFTLYSHARVIIDEWAQQFAQLAASSPGTPVSAGSRVTLLPM